jgi:HK97 family phage major capsid protein
MTKHPRFLWAARMTALAAVVASFGVRADALSPEALEDPVIQQHIARQIELTDANTALFAQVDTEKRDLTAEERKLVADNCNEVDRIQDEIALRVRVLAHARATNEPGQRRSPAGSGDNPAGASAGQSQTQAAGTRQATGAAGQSQPHVQTVALTQATHRAAMRGNNGFRNMGDFCNAVRAASMNGGSIDNRLQMAAASTIGSEGVGADGGFAVPPDYRQAIEVMVMGEQSLLAQCDQYPTSSNRVTVPTDETTPWGTSGVRAYWGAEAGVQNQSKPALKELTTVLHKLHALVPLTDELTSDGPLVSALITRKAGDAMQYKVTDAILNGNGVGQPLGILNSPCLVTAAAEASQVADTIHGLNIIAMWGRLPAAVRSRAVWIVNQDVEVKLMTIGLQIGPAAAGAATGGQLLYMPPGGLSGLPYGTLLGRPVIVTEAAKAIGDVGDIILAFLGGYFAPVKGGGLVGTTSMHLWFDQDLVAYKWTMRLGGQPWLQAAITRANGGNTLSHFIALAAR